jgi:hypothetical protein
MIEPPVYSAVAPDSFDNNTLRAWPSPSPKITKNADE